MVFIGRGPCLSAFEELLIDEELAREAALKEATEAANKRMPTLEEARLGSKAKADVKTSCSVKATSVTTQMEESMKNRCPVCGGQHKATYADGRVVYFNTLGACEVWREKSLEEKVSLIQLAGACSYCFDWTRSHKDRDCLVEKLSRLEEEELDDALDDDSSLGEEVEVNSGKEPSAKEEQAKEAALRTVVRFGQKIAACERFILAKTEAKAIEKG